MALMISLRSVFTLLAQKWSGEVRAGQNRVNKYFVIEPPQQIHDSLIDVPSVSTLTDKYYSRCALPASPPAGERGRPTDTSALGAGRPPGLHILPFDLLIGVVRCCFCLLRVYGLLTKLYIECCKIHAWRPLSGWVMTVLDYTSSATSSPAIRSNKYSFLQSWAAARCRCPSTWYP